MIDRYSRAALAGLVGALFAAVPSFADAPAPASPDAANAAPAGVSVLPATEVTSTRVPEPVTDAASSVTVITADQIEAKMPFDLTDIIDLAPGVSEAQYGSRGQLTSVFIRGANPNNTLVLIDGIRVNTPSSGGFDFGSIPAENIERIEVLRGPQSALYGADAAGGVINIITKRGDGKLRASGTIEYGNFNTEREVASVSGNIGKDNLSLEATHLRSGGEFPNDDFHSVGASVRLDHALDAISRLSFIGRIDNGDLGDNGAPVLSPDPLERLSPRDLTTSVQYTRDGQGRRDSISMGLLDRTLLDNAPLFNGSSSNSTIYDQVVSLNAQTTLRLGKNEVTTGIDSHDDVTSTQSTSVSSYGPSTASFNHEITTIAAFGQDEFRSGGWDVVPGVRFEDNSQFGDIWSGRLAAGYALDHHARLKASIGSGFRAPTMDDLYYPGYSNPNLKPEQSVGYDAGFEYDWTANRTVEVTAFQNVFHDLIQPNPATYIPENVDRATTDGIELGVRQALGPGLTGIVNYGYLHWTTNGAPLLRRPNFTGSADLLYRHRSVSADLGLVAQGQRVDNNYVTDTTSHDYPGFQRVDLTFGYDVRRDLQVYTRMQNLFNLKYQEIAGYPAPLFNFVVGIKAKTF